MRCNTRNMEESKESKAIKKEPRIGVGKKESKGGRK